MLTKLFFKSVTVFSSRYKRLTTLEKIDSSIELAMGLGIRIQKTEAFLRLSAIVMLVLTACLVGLDSQTKVIFYVEKKASFKDLRALVGLVYITSLAAAYNLLQLCCSSFSARCKGSSCHYAYLAWILYVMDQASVYVVFAGNLAAMEHSLLVVTGEENFQWTKWCNKYTRFCTQIGGSLFCGFAASFLMACIATISAYNLFRLYSPTKVLHLKPK